MKQLQFLFKIKCPDFHFNTSKTCFNFFLYLPMHKGFITHASPEVTLEEDLERRDLTINAMAMDERGALIDPFGGQADIEQKCLRHISDAFSEDPLRVFRLARFYARYAHLGFFVYEETENLCIDIVVRYGFSQRERLKHLVLQSLGGEVIVQFAVVYSDLTLSFRKINTGYGRLSSSNLVNRLHFI